MSVSEGARREARKIILERLKSNVQVVGTWEETDLQRYALIEKSFVSGEHWISTHPSMEAAAKYNLQQEYGGDWEIVALHDLDTGDQYEAVRHVTWKPAAQGGQA